MVQVYTIHLFVWIVPFEFVYMFILWDIYHCLLCSCLRWHLSDGVCVCALVNGAIFTLDILIWKHNQPQVLARSATDSSTSATE